ncbi:MAG TPA: hypothetical protein VGT98_05755 [Candidatus Elarobacter sp.]|nr:hypothetical protein [Candidatus Elarobacter sp.]
MVAAGASTENRPTLFLPLGSSGCENPGAMPLRKCHKRPSPTRCWSICIRPLRSSISDVRRDFSRAAPTEGPARIVSCRAVLPVTGSGAVAPPRLANLTVALASTYTACRVVLVRLSVQLTDTSGSSQ